MKTLIAALLLADEVHEAKSATRAPAAAPAFDDSQAERLEAIAAKLEACALALEG
jgi:HD superfamily phosphodiesterase